MYVKDERQQRLEIAYDVIREVIEKLEPDLETEYGGIDYKKVQYLSAAYSMNDYLANELAAYPDDEYIAYMEEQQAHEDTEVRN